MQPDTQHSREILRTNQPLIQRIVAITSQRRRLSTSEQQSLSDLVRTKLTETDKDRLGRFKGASSLRSYLSVVVQKLYQALTRQNAENAPGPENTAVANAIRETTSTLSSRESLVLKMWFESGMTTQKIATVLGMRAREVHAVVAKRTDRVQDCLARSRTSPSTARDDEESL